jgi:hypothetical protein
MKSSYTAILNSLYIIMQDSAVLKSLELKINLGLTFFMKNLTVKYGKSTKWKVLVLAELLSTIHKVRFYGMQKVPYINTLPLG